MSTKEIFAAEEVRRLTELFASSNSLQIVQWAVDTFGDRFALASSFGAEDMVLVHMLAKTTDSPNVFFLDTGRLHQETYEVLGLTRAKYDVEIDVYFPQTDAVESLLKEKGPNSFYDSVENRKECCYIRKIEPLKRALSGMDAWMTGLRSEQSVTRTDMQAVEIDKDHGSIVKINPLVTWSEEDVWNYLSANDVTYNALHDKGFPSIGCAPCTRVVKQGEDQRAGRWWWESPELRECGLHIKNGRVIRR